MIHVCHLLNAIGKGGAEVLTLEMIRHTDDDDVKYTVYYLGAPHTLAPEFEAAGARVIHLGSRTAIPQLDPTVGFKLFAALATDEFDIVHAHMPYVQVVARIAANTLGSAKVVSTQHTVEDTLPGVSRRLGSWTQPLDSATVAVSKGVQHSYTGRSNSYRDGGLNGKWCTIYNGIDAAEFSEKVKRLAERTPDGEDEEIRFVNIGRFRPEKAQLDLVEAMKTVTQRLPNSHLYIVGSSGPLENRLREEVERAGLDDHVSVVYHDADEFDIHEYYALADVFVSASILEGMPITHLEAMASELPVVATDIPGVREVIDEGKTGLLTPPNAPEELAKTMLAFDSKDTCHQFGRRGYRRVKRRFSIEQTVNAYLDLYRELLSTP